jgi:small subunit ribosomal protein S17
MADDEDNQMSDEQQPAAQETEAAEVQAEQAAEAPAGDAAGQAAESPEQAAEPAAEAEQAPEPEQAAEPAAEAEQVPEPEQTAEPAEAEQVPEPEAQAAPASPKPPAEPAEQLSPKERRRRKRSLHVGPAHQPRTPEERQAERDAVRRAKATRRRARRLQERAKRAEHRVSPPAMAPLAPVHPAKEGVRRVRQGVVVSNKADKTITVRIDVARRHRRYEKIVRSSSTLHAHDENNDAHEGDVVRVIESRPLSRTKRWRLVDVLERAR